jgi:hypothetical protein
MHIGQELEAHEVEKVHLSCNSGAPQVGSVRSDSTRVAKVNHRKTNRRKTIPYCITRASFSDAVGISDYRPVAPDYGMIYQ